MCEVKVCLTDAHKTEDVTSIAKPALKYETYETLYYM